MAEPEAGERVVKNRGCQISVEPWKAEHINMDRIGKVEHMIQKLEEERVMGEQANRNKIEDREKTKCSIKLANLILTHATNSYFTSQISASARSVWLTT